MCSAVRRESGTVRRSIETRQREGKRIHGRRRGLLEAHASRIRLQVVSEALPEKPEAGREQAVAVLCSNLALETGCRDAHIQGRERA